MVCDLGSTNGTYLNGTQIRGWVPIVPGMTLRIGRSEIPWNPQPYLPRTEAKNC